MNVSPFPLSSQKKSRFERFLQRRLPPSNNVTLNRKTIFVLPTMVGLGFLITALLIWVLGTNYQSNLALATSYFMVSIFVLAVVHTFNNVSGVTLSYLDSGTAFAGEYVPIRLRLSTHEKSPRQHLQLSWPGTAPEVIDLVDNMQVDVSLAVNTAARGWYCPGRLLVESHYPLGLIRCWTWIDLDIRALIYPAPLLQPLPDSVGHVDDGEDEVADGAEDFYGLRPYQEGHSLAHVSWKHYARGLDLQLKEFSDYRSEDCWLNWDLLAGRATEERLSILTGWVLSLSKTTVDYGLVLPGFVSTLGRGQVHQQQLLRQLALYGVANTESEHVN